MSTAARIDELRKNFEDNPRRYFAPLANELRKAGHLSEAIALCRECLPKQPEHMSGYIVFGQALYESGDLSGARMVFEQALSLDPENLKALRHLGDIAKREGDTAGARRWYERVLEADPRNDDIAAQLATLTTPVRLVPAPAAFFAPPTSVSPMPPVPTPLFSMAPIGLGGIPTPVAALRAVDFDEFNARLWVPEPTPTERVASPVETAVGGTVVEESADDPFGFSETATAEVPFELLLEEGLIAPDWPDTSELVARIATPRTATPVFVPSLTPDAVAAFGVESRDPLPAPAPDGKAPVEPTPAAPVEVEAPVGGAVAAAKATIATVRPEVAALFGDGRTNFADLDSESGPVELSSADVMPEEHNPAFVTATMGELLVSQGFTARAVSVYEELVRRRPYDPVLTSRLAELRARLATDAGPVTPAFTAPASATPLSATAISSGAYEAADSEEDQSARVTARERFARLSLRRVPRRTPPRVSVETPAASDASGPFSFGRFFTDPATVSSPPPMPAHSPSHTPATEPAREVPPPTVSDDLAQFSAWFKGLGNT
jgi:tetratricopeptide (TPR) repeat protein